MQEVHIDGEKLYNGLKDYFGTAMSVPQFARMMTAALGELEAAHDREDWDHIIEMALDSGLDLDEYAVEDVPDWYADPAVDEFEPGRFSWDEMAANP